MERCVREGDCTFLPDHAHNPGAKDGAQFRQTGVRTARCVHERAENAKGAPLPPESDAPRDLRYPIAPEYEPSLTGPRF